MTRPKPFNFKQRYHALMISTSTVPMIGVFYRTRLLLDRGGKFLKELWYCASVGEYNRVISIIS